MAKEKKLKPVLGRDYKVAEGFPTFDSLDEFFKWEKERTKDSMEQIKRDNKICPEDDYETCEAKVAKVILLYYTHRLDGWNYFKSIFDDIPREYRKRLLMFVFESCVVDGMEFMELLDSCSERSVNRMILPILCKENERVI